MYLIVCAVESGNAVVSHNAISCSTSSLCGYKLLLTLKTHICTAVGRYVRQCM